MPSLVSTKEDYEERAKKNKEEWLLRKQNNERMVNEKRQQDKNERVKKLELEQYWRHHLSDRTGLRVLQRHLYAAQKHARVCTASGRYQEGDVWNKYANFLESCIVEHAQYTASMSSRQGVNRDILNRLIGHMLLVREPNPNDHGQYELDRRLVYNRPELYQNVSIRGTYRPEVQMAKTKKVVVYYAEEEDDEAVQVDDEEEF